VQAASSSEGALLLMVAPSPIITQLQLSALQKLPPPSCVPAQAACLKHKYQLHTAVGTAGQASGVTVGIVLGIRSSDGATFEGSDTIMRSRGAISVDGAVHVEGAGGGRAAVGV
jgi:hypothetical protein